MSCLYHCKGKYLGRILDLMSVTVDRDVLLQSIFPVKINREIAAPSGEAHPFRSACCRCHCQVPNAGLASWAMGVGKPASPPPFFRGGRRRLTKRRSVQVSLIRGKVLLEMCVGVGKRSAALSLEEEGCGICTTASCYRGRPRARFRACDDFCPFRLTRGSYYITRCCHCHLPPIGDGAATEQLRSSGFHMWIYTTENLHWSAWIYA